MEIQEIEIDDTPEYIKPDGDAIPGPVRLTVSEWISMCEGWNDGETVFYHHKFTMTTEYGPCPTRLNKIHGGIPDSKGVMRYTPEFDLCITLAFPGSRAKWVVYGPYDRGHNLAIARAGEHLIKQKILVLLDMPEGATPREWIKQEYQQYVQRRFQS